MLVVWSGYYLFDFSSDGMLNNAWNQKEIDDGNHSEDDQIYFDPLAVIYENIQYCYYTVQGKNPQIISKPVFLLVRGCPHCIIIIVEIFLFCKIEF